MQYTKLRNELNNYYQTTSYENAEKVRASCYEQLDKIYEENMTAYDMTAMQYQVITDNINPVIFENSPFFFETGTIPGQSDGAWNYQGHEHAAGWTYRKNFHKIIDFDEELYNLRLKQGGAKMYLVCGPYNDISQHFQINHRPVFESGLKGVYERAKDALNKTSDPEETNFLSAMCTGILCVKKISEKFAIKAQKLAEENPNNPNYKIIAETAMHCPWEKPRNIYEALNTYAFMRKVIGSLEGIGPNSFGRVDLDLYPFYEQDIKNGTFTKDEIFELICQFLILWDTHYDHDKPMVGYSDHELENTYVVGGCDKDGKPVFNELTEMFLNATVREKIIFPKIKCRFSGASPKAYLDLINKPVINGMSTIIYCNDDAIIPAFVRGGRTLEEARDYVVAGCWGAFTNCNDCRDDANYTNILRAFEYEIHQPKEKMAEINMIFEPVDKANSFEELYEITCRNIDVLFRERTRVITKGGNMWHEVAPHPLYSSTFVDCIGSRKDFTAGGTKYKDDVYMCLGFPNIIDSMLAIKKLCFDDKKYSLKDFLSAVRNNWEGAENMRVDAIACPGWGDGSHESCELASRFNSDLYKMLEKIPGIRGGKIHLGHLTYTEIRFWAEDTAATPDGRKAGEYFAQGLTPSRLNKIPSVTSVINSLAALDKSELGGNSVVNIILPGNISLEACEAFLRAASTSALQSLQLNCVSKETLLDAQKHPEKYPELIIRVCGFSAKFTSLSPEWQQEVLTRNFYE